MRQRGWNELDDLVVVEAPRHGREVEGREEMDLLVGEAGRGPDPTERLDPAGSSGTGVGLTIVQKAVERMGGAVGVESRPGEGSTFWVELEAARA